MTWRDSQSLSHPVSGTPSGGSLPVIVLILSPETDNFAQNNVPDERVDLWTACIQSGHAIDQATAPNEFYRFA